MNTGNDSQFLEQVKRRLDTHADGVPGSGLNTARAAGCL